MGWESTLSVDEIMIESEWAPMDKAGASASQLQAEAIFLAMLADAGVAHVRTKGSQVERVAKEGTVLKSLTLEGGQTYTAKVFIEGTYEGDLMSRSQTSFTWGREAAATYNEGYAGLCECAATSCVALSAHAMKPSSPAFAASSQNTFISICFYQQDAANRSAGRTSENSRHTTKRAT